ncbi:MAG TPA: outer membrane beta-barrel domain-containing protein [Polyangia bacterium]|jgi:outer membrane beta-barrel protein
MRQVAFGLFAILLLAGPGSALAQEEEEKKPAAEEKKPDETPPPATPAPAATPTPAPAAGTPEPAAAAPAAPAGQSSQWADIVVVPRKQVIKARRWELAPLFGITVNDPMIRHYQFGGQINYYLTDVLWLGVEGAYLQPEREDRFYLTPQQYRRVPKANKYLWEAALDFGYVPAYGKFALFNKHIIHWEGIVTAGVGVTQSEVIPMDPSYEGFQSYAITPNFGAGLRVFLTKWLVAFAMIRDYVVLDKFEPCRDASVCPTQTAYPLKKDAQAHAESGFMNNLFFTVGVGFYLPPSFKYTSSR